MIRYLAIVAFISLGSLISASDPLDKIYNDSTLRSDLREIVAQDTPDSSAYKGITQYLLVMAFSEEQLIGKTYREILDLSRLWAMKQQIRDDQEKALAEQAELEQEQRYERMRKMVGITLGTRELIALDSAVTTTYPITLTNYTNKSINSIEGSVEISHELSSYFIRLDLNFAEPLPARSSRQEKVPFKQSKDFGQNQNGTSGPEKLIWRPERIRFADGSVLE